jgi:hypothetical protein
VNSEISEETPFPRGARLADNAPVLHHERDVLEGLGIVKRVGGGGNDVGRHAGPQAPALSLDA